MGSVVVLEASGGYDRPLTAALAEAGVPYAQVNPRQAREFARSVGKLATTDRGELRFWRGWGGLWSPDRRRHLTSTGRIWRNLWRAGRIL